MQLLLQEKDKQIATLEQQIRDNNMRYDDVNKENTQLKVEVAELKVK